MAVTGRSAGRRRASQSGSVLTATSVLMARTATDSVATVKASLSQISVSVWVARCTADSFRFAQAASRSSGLPGPVTMSTSLASAACAV